VHSREDGDEALFHVLGHGEVGHFLLGYGVECLQRPLEVVVDGAAVHERREVPDVRPEVLVRRRKRKNDVEILFNRFDLHFVHVVVGLLHQLFNALLAARLVDGFEVVDFVEIRNVLGIEEVTDVLQLFFVYDLVFDDHEHTGYLFRTGLNENLPQV